MSEANLLHVAQFAYRKGIDVDRFLDFIKHLRDFLNLDYRALFILSCIGWAMFLLPQPLWAKLGLSSLGAVSRPWSFAVGLIFTVWLVSALVYDLGSKVTRRAYEGMGENRRRSARESLLLATSRVEKEVLARYLTDDTTTLAWDMRDGVVNGLVAKGILVRSSTASNPMSYDFDTNIQSWAWDYLKQHPSLLQDIKATKSGRHHIWE